MSNKNNTFKLSILKNLVTIAVRDLTVISSCHCKLFSSPRSESFLSLFIMQEVQLRSSSDFITVNVSNSKNDSIAFEKKFPKCLTVAQLKSKLEIITGGNASTMQLELYNGDNLVAKLSHDDQIIGSLPIEVGMRLHVIDNFSWLSEETVEKFELTDEQYDKKGDTVRSFLKQNRLGKYNSEELKEIEDRKKRLAELELQKIQLCEVGVRCQVTVKGYPIRRGTIMYIGSIEGKGGTFIGVKYDEPLGKNDGSINGKRYFECQPKYGGFVAPNAVEVGDFPPEDTMEGIDDEL